MLEIFLIVGFCFCCRARKYKRCFASVEEAADFLKTRFLSAGFYCISETTIVCFT